jgi:WD40 repeat protein
MCKSLKNIALLFILFLTFHAGIKAQNNKVEVAFQQGHAKDIMRIDLSSDNRFIATFGKDYKIIIWDYKSGSQIAFKYIDFYPEYLQFSAQSNYLYLGANYTQKALSIATMNYSDSAPTMWPRQPNKTNSFHNGIQYRIDGAKIIWQDSNSAKVLKTRTSDYFDQPFNSILYSTEHKLYLAACEDGHIYVFDANYKLVKQLKGHNSGANEIALSSEQQYLFSVSADRSIIKWQLSTYEQVARYTGLNFPLYSVATNSKGSQVLFGDEIGYLKSLSITESKLKISSQRQYIYPLNHIVELNDSKHIIAGEDNVLRVIQGKDVECIRNIKFGAKPPIHRFFTQTLNLYQAPYSEYYHIAGNGNSNRFAYFGIRNKFIPKYLRIAEITENNRLKLSPKLYVKDHDGNSKILFLNDSVLLSSVNTREFVIWKIRDNNIRRMYYKKIRLERDIETFVYFNSSMLAGYNKQEICIYNIHNGEWHTASRNGVKNIFPLGENEFAFTDANNHIYTASLRGDSIWVRPPHIGHLDSVTKICYSPIKNILISSSIDGSIRIWDPASSKLKVTIIPVGIEDYVAITPDNYYMLSSKRMQSFGFKMGTQFFLPEQFDPFYNRPDIVLQRLGYASQSLIDAYKKAYLKRIEKMGFNESMLNADFHLPELKVLQLSSIPAETNAGSQAFTFVVSDSKYPVDRYNVWVNNVPIYGVQGVSLRQQNTTIDTISCTVPLSAGKNKIQFSCMNQKGAESYKISVPIQQSTTEKPKSKLYFIGIGIDHYAQSGKDLKYSVKDIRDLATVLKKEYGNAIEIDTLFNQHVTQENILQLKKKLANSQIDDKVIISYSGHGLLDSNFNYFLSSYNVNFDQPQEGGIPYSDLEWLLDSIPARKKLMLIDACHSGEIDKAEVKMMEDTAAVLAQNNQEKGSKIRVVSANSGALGLKNSFELMQELFLNVSKGCGATIISAAGGDQAALEGDAYKNGYFTYAVLNYLKSHSTVSINELKAYVFSEVERLSEGKQKPTSRSENLDSDWNLIE